MTDQELSIGEHDRTRDLLLAHAEEVFAEKGFEAASSREILRRAGVKNAAAINYYFRDKDSLYREVVRNAHVCCNTGIEFPEWPIGLSPVQKLREFVGVIAQRMFFPQRPSALRIMMREMSDPTFAGESVINEYIRPMAGMLRSILDELTPGTPEIKRWMIGFSIVGQALYYRQNRSVSERLAGSAIYEQLTPQMIAEHIVEFTLRGIGIDPSQVPAVEYRGETTDVSSEVLS